MQGESDRELTQTLRELRATVQQLAEGVRRANPEQHTQPAKGASQSPWTNILREAFPGWARAFDHFKQPEEEPKKPSQSTETRPPVAKAQPSNVMQVSAFGSPFKAQPSQQPVPEVSQTKPPEPVPPTPPARPQATVATTPASIPREGAPSSAPTATARTTLLWPSLSPAPSVPPRRSTLVMPEPAPPRAERPETSSFRPLTPSPRDFSFGVGMPMPTRTAPEPSRQTTVLQSQSPVPAVSSPFRPATPPSAFAAPGATGAMTDGGDFADAVREFKEVVREMKAALKNMGKGEEAGPQPGGGFTPGGPSPMGEGFAPHTPEPRTPPRASIGGLGPWMSRVLGGR